MILKTVLLENKRELLEADFQFYIQTILLTLGGKQ